MKYALLIYSDETLWEGMNDGQRGEIVGRYMAVSEDLKRRGQFIVGEPLAAAQTASTVRLRDGKTLVTDGPFAETNAIGARLPTASMGSIEVRPVPDYGG